MNNKKKQIYIHIYIYIYTYKTMINLSSVTKTTLPLLSNYEAYVHYKK